MGEENNQIVLIFVISAAFVVLLAVLLILFVVIYNKRIVTQENRLQKLENERQQLLLKATIEGQERERSRLAKDLHDSIGALLSGLSLNLKFQKSKEDTNSKQFAFLEDACQLVQEGIENVRKVSHNLLPSTLEDFGLISAMEESVAFVNQYENLQIMIKCEHPKMALSNTIALGLLRVFQELIQNTIKHAEATKVNAIISCEADDIVLTYNDNGVGFNGHLKDSKGIGMKNIQSRIQALDGIFDIDYTAPKGFNARIKVPLKTESIIG